MTYLTTPRYGGHANSLKILQSLILQARRGNRTPHAVRIAIDGDSRSTAPGGFGNQVVAMLVYESWKVFGNIPASQILKVANSSGAIGAASTGATTSGTNAIGDALANRFPYSADPANNSRRASNSYGFLQNMNHRLDGVDAALTEIDRTSIEYINRTGLRWNAMIPYVSTQGANLQVNFLRNTTGATSYFGGSLGATQVVNIAAAQSASNDWLNLSGPFNWGGFTPNSGNLSSLYGLMELRSNSGTEMVEVGPAWFTSSDTRGFEWHSFSEGGKKMPDQQVDRPNSGPFATRFDPDIWYIALGANDTGQGVTAAQFSADAQAKINWRLSMNPGAICVLIADYDTNSTTNGAEWANYADVLYSLSQVSANRSVFINRRRILEEATGGLFNRSSGSFGTYCPDGVHPSVTAARLIAKNDLAALLAMGSTAVISRPNLGIQIG